MRTSRSTSASWNNLRCLLRPWCASHAAIDPWCAISAARPSTKAPVEAPRSARSCSAVGTPCGAARRAVAGKAATRNPKGADTYGIPSCLVCAAVVAAQSLRQSLQSALVCHCECRHRLSSRSCYSDSAPAAAMCDGSTRSVVWPGAACCRPRTGPAAGSLPPRPRRTTHLAPRTMHAAGRPGAEAAAGRRSAALVF
jgi:hypothetical protein